MNTQNFPLLTADEKKIISDRIYQALTDIDVLTWAFQETQCLEFKKEHVQTKDYKKALITIFLEKKQANYGFRDYHNTTWDAIRDDVVIKFGSYFFVDIILKTEEKTNEGQNINYQDIDDFQLGQKKIKELQEFSIKEYARIMTCLLLPDNALRMLQRIEQYQATMRLLKNEDYEKFINALMKAQNEDTAQDVFREFPKNGLSDKDLEQLRLASLSNDELLNKADEVCSDAAVSEQEKKRDAAALKQEKKRDTAASKQEKKKYCREIEGRLLRPVLVTKADEREIQKKLMKPTQYAAVKETIHEDFKKRSEKMHDFLESMKPPHSLADSIEVQVEESFINPLDPPATSEPSETRGENKESEKSEPPKVVKTTYEFKDFKHQLVNEIVSNWKKPTGDPDKDILHFRDNFVNLEHKIPELKEKMKRDRRPWLSHIHAAFVALGCIAVVGIPFTLFAMYHSKRHRGTVFFTHAPHSSLVPHKAEKTLKKLGHIKTKHPKK